MRGPNMSYCMFENTVSAMRQILEALSEADTKADLNLNQYEQRAYQNLKEMCEEIVYEIERLEDAEGDFEPDEEEENEED